ncbi:acyl transferase 9-like isoform X1 [Zingiber officinale]|nr:acyl transferase 9-like isoform X1 [Zingiber officinale]
MGFTVTKISEGYVRPAEPTPPGSLTLDWIGRYPTHRGLVDSLHIFRYGKDPAGVIRKALARALVHYYPIAGRIVQPEGCEPRIECTGDGVWFVAASADCSLADVNYLERPMMLGQNDILPYTELETSPANTLVMIQVTEFTCGGFVMGLRTNHAFADGLGSAQVISAIGDLARGLPEPIVKPVWNRDSYPNPKIKPAPLPDLPKLALEYSAVDFPTHYLNQLKKQYKVHSNGKWCSTFDIIIAKVWQCRNRAIYSDPDVNIRLCFFASTRHILKIDKGYCGNSIFPVKVLATSGKINTSSVVEIVDLIKEAKDQMATDVQKWANDEFEVDPFSMTFNYETIYISDWTKLGFSEVDYGWGVPVYCGPFTNNDYIASCILLKAPAPFEGTRLVARCVSKEHIDAFNKRVNQFD